MNEKKLLENIFEIVANTNYKEEAILALSDVNIELDYNDDYIDFTLENGDIYRLTIKKIFSKNPE